MTGRLTATTVKTGGTTRIESPQPGEDLFLYITDGAGEVHYDGENSALGQYDVLLARSNANAITVRADQDVPLPSLSFYLPSFINEFTHLSSV